MNHSTLPENHCFGTNGSLNHNSIPWEPQINAEAGYTGCGVKNSCSTSATAREGIQDPSTPNSKEDIEAGLTQLHGILKPRNIMYAFRPWLPELGCCILSTFAVIADVIILLLADGQPPTQIIHHVTVNSLIQFITSVAKFAFLIPIASVLGQLKWLWFKKSARPLTDFQLYDCASSGGWGSLKFSLKWRILMKSPLAWLAAVVALSALFTSSLTQQCTGFVSAREILANGTASVLRATTISRADGTRLITDYGDDRLIQTAYLTAAYLGPNQTLPGVDPVCSTGDCDWPTYGSLGICAEIVNISASTNSSLLSELQEEFLIELRDSQYSTVFAGAGSGPYYLAVVMPFLYPSTEFKEAPFQTIISQYFIGYFNSPVNLTDNADLAKIQYTGVSLYFCTQSFSTTVKGGIYDTTELGSSSTILHGSTNKTINSVWNTAIEGIHICDPGPETGSTITLGGAIGLANETYTIDFCTGSYLSQLYVIGTSGGILLDLDRAVQDTVGQISQALGDAIYGGFNASTIPDFKIQYENVKLMTENIATSLTNYMRNQGPTFPNQDNATITGTAYSLQTLIHVRWPYISFLVLQLVLTVIILIFTIISTHWNRVQILKGSSLATMIALSPELKRELRWMEDIEAVERNAEGLRVWADVWADGAVMSLVKTA